jgi:hypothetical protein
MESLDTKGAKDLSSIQKDSSAGQRSFWLPLIGAGLAVGALFNASKFRMFSRNRVGAVQLRAIKDAVARSRGQSTSKG